MRALATVAAVPVMLMFALPDVAASAGAAATADVTAGAVRAAPAVVLVNRPVSSLCSGHRFKVGVWYQAISGGSRAYSGHRPGSSKWTKFQIIIHARRCSRR